VTPLARSLAVAGSRRMLSVGPSRAGQIALADLAAAVRDGLVESDAEGGRMMALTLVQLRGFEPLTPCMPCSFGLLPRPRSGTCAQSNGLLQLTVTVRCIPLVTAPYGTRVPRPARTTMLAPRGRRLPARPEGEARPRRPLHRWQDPKGFAAGRTLGPQTSASPSCLVAASPLWCA
jgi:hypothetical protein